MILLGNVVLSPFLPDTGGEDVFGEPVVTIVAGCESQPDPNSHALLGLAPNHLPCRGFIQVKSPTICALSGIFWTEAC